MNSRPCGAEAVCRAARFWLLWLLPLARSLISPAQTALIVRDALPAVLMTLYSVLQWRYCRYCLREDESGSFHSVELHRGIVFRRFLHLCAEDAASIEIERTPLLWLLRARRIRISTAGLRRRSDAVLCLSAAQTRRLFFLSPRTQRSRSVRVWPTIVLALSGSDALVGVLTVVPLLRGISRLLGEGLPDRLLMVGNELWVGLPPLLGRLANLLLLGWGVAALGTFFRYMGFRAKRDSEHLHITSGFFTRRDMYIDRDKITALEYRQTLMLRLWGLDSAVITAAGYGRDLRARPVLVPAANAARMAAALVELLPGYPKAAVSVRPLSRIRYAAGPLLFLAVGFAGVLLGELGSLFAAAWVIAGAWWLLVRLLGFESAGFGMDSRGITVCYPQRLALYRVHIPREVADHITVTQTPFQRMCGTCTVQVRCFGEKRRRHRVYGLPLDTVQALLQPEKFNENLT